MLLNKNDLYTRINPELKAGISLNSYNIKQPIRKQQQKQCKIITLTKLLKNLSINECYKNRK